MEPQVTSSVWLSLLVFAPKDTFRDTLLHPLRDTPANLFSRSHFFIFSLFITTPQQPLNTPVFCFKKLPLNPMAPSQQFYSQDSASIHLPFVSAQGKSSSAHPSPPLPSWLLKIFSLMAISGPCLAQPVWPPPELFPVSL